MNRIRKTVLLLFLILGISSPSLIIAQEDFISQSLFFTVYVDGAVGVDYSLDVDSSIPRISVPLFGELYQNIVVFDEFENPLDYDLFQGIITIDTLGSDKVDIYYETFDMTNKTERIWTFAEDVPIDATVSLPETATIISINQLPKAITTMGQRTIITVPSGTLQLSYSIGILGTREHAITLIIDAEDKITEITEKGVVIPEAESLVEEAKTYLEKGEFIRAEELASNALELISQITNLSQQARESILDVQSKINKVLQDQNDANLDEAQKLLDESLEKYSLGEYNDSIILSEKALKSIPNDLSSEEDISFLLLLGFIGGAIIAASIITYIIFNAKLKKNSKSSDLPTLKKWRDIDLTKILQEKNSLRLEDQEVIRFIAESGGEVFENEVREKFQLPKTTVWRMGKRLVDAEIITIKNLRGNNLLRILDKYIL